MSSLSNILRLLSTRVINRASQVVTFVLIARVLGPSGFGFFSLFTSIAYLAGQFGNLGIRQSLARDIGQNELTISGGFGVVITLLPILTLFCSIAAIISLPVPAIFSSYRYDLSFVMPMAVGAILLISLIQGIMLGLGNIRAFGTADAGPRVLFFGLVVAAWLGGALDLRFAMWCFAGSFLAFAPVAFLLAGGRRNPSFPLGRIPALVRRGLVFAIWILLASLQPRIGAFVLSVTDSSEAVGQYFAAQRACDLFLELATVISLVIFSDAVRHDRSRSDTINEGAQVALVIFLIFGIVACALQLAAPFVVGILLGESYMDAGAALRIIALGLPAAAAARILNGLISGLGRPGISVGVAASGLLANLGLNWILRDLGLLGAAWALTVSYHLTLLLYLVIFRAMFDMRMGPLLLATSEMMLERLNRLSKGR